MGGKRVDLLTRREALATMGALMGVALLDHCGGGAATDTTTGTITTTTPYPITGDWIPPVFLTESASGLKVPYQLFIPAGASPSTPLPLVMHVNGAGQRGYDPTLLIAPGAGLGDMVNTHKTAVPKAFYFFPQEMGGPDPAGLRYSRNFYYQALQDVLSKYNVDSTRMHLSGYSAGAQSIIDFAYRFPKIFASLTIWDGMPHAFGLTNEQDPNSDVLSTALYPCVGGALDHHSCNAARAAWAKAVGDIPINFQHGALNDTGADPVSSGNNPLIANGCTASWFSTFAANGQTAPTQVTATTHPSPGYSASLHSVYVPYSTYSHGDLNTFAVGAMDNPWWAWWQARKRTDYT